jgi:Cd2+/Zn2+-exporting ATPase
MKRFKIQNLDCAHCAIKLEERLREFPGVRHVAVNFASETLTIDAEDIDSAIYEAKRQEPGINIVASESEKKEKKISGDILTLAAASALSIGAFALSRFAPAVPAHAVTAMYLAAWLVAGYNVLLSSFRNIIRGTVFDENFLMTISTVCAFIVGAPAEAAGVMIFYNAGELLQERALRRSRAGISDVLSIKNEQAIVVRNGREERVSPESVSPGETIRVFAGMRVPLDGVIRKGKTAFDVSALTGESVPVNAEEGSEILSGSVNTAGVVDITVTKILSESYMSKVLRLVEESSARKARTEKFITRFARYYTPAAVAAAALTAVIPWIFLGTDPKDSFYRACVLLVISCPCALVISVPLGYFGGIGGAARKGILIKGSAVIDALAGTKTAVFDKTGTLTSGKFSVTDITAYNGFDSGETIRLAAAACSASTHPISRAIAERVPDAPAALSHTEHPGMGMEAVVSGKTVLAGNKRLMEKAGITVPESSSTGIFVAIDSIPAAYISVEDTPKSDAADAVRELSGNGIDVVMLTGDGKAAATSIAGRLDIRDVRSELLPHRKVEEIESIMKHSSGGSVVFVGDGINDAPVLARADCGIAMGGLGSDAAIESADAVIMNDSPLKAHEAVIHAKKTKKIIMQNIAFALGVKAAFAFLGVFGIATMWEAVFADTGVALLAVFNAMRALRP